MLNSPGSDPTPRSARAARSMQAAIRPQAPGRRARRLRHGTGVIPPTRRRQRQAGGAMQTLEDVQTWRGRKMVDPEGDKIGTIEDILLDRHTGEPAWAAVKTGLFGLKHTLVPIRDATPVGDDEVRVPFQKEQVKDAPRIDPDDALTP